MSSIYLIRHGQAGVRTNYDALSELGRRQSRLLGEWFAAQNIEFEAAFSGGLNRQRETASEVCGAYALAGLSFPAVATDLNWDEFDFDAIYKELAPQLAETDARFRAEYEEMLAQLGDEDHPVHRRWSRCDVMVVRSWIEGRLSCRGESWQAFQDRVSSRLERFAQFGPRENIAVFTSGTPIGVWTGLAVGGDARTRMRLAGVIQNSAYVTLRLKEGELTLFSFNNVPHLPDPAMRTYR